MTVEADTLYERDFYAWTQDQAARLRALMQDAGGRNLGLDLANLVEEVETLGRSEKRVLESPIRLLLMHALKWEHQAERRSRSWEASIIGAHRSMLLELRNNPSLKPQLPEIAAEAFADARVAASGETDLALKAFPESCPFSVQDILAPDLPARLLGPR